MTAPPPPPASLPPPAAPPAPAASSAPPALSGCDRPLARAYDVALLDLDGVVYRGPQPVPHAAEALAAARGAGMRAAFVTNNALRRPAEVAAHLSAIGIPAAPEEVVTSAQAAARLLAQRLPPGSRVLIAGGPGLRDEVDAVGLRPVQRAGEGPLAVVQGFDPEITYARLAEAALAVRAGALWVATNTDATVPTDRGLLPGNGSLLALVGVATGRAPALVAGKPERALHEESVRRSGARHPLVVGDRLDTDVEGGVRAATAVLLVLTGVATAADLFRAPARQRPTYVAADLRGLLRAQHGAVVTGGRARCGGWACRVDDGVLRWEGRVAGGHGDGGHGDDGLDALRAACAAAWAAADAGRPVRSVAAPRPPGCETLG
ncbi:MAG TPA: HAD-IIA family hydrolase [Frankiaceae bacterium]|nr:HAD-IIA family hydrolase [Frankiaceae bacterium]